MALQSVLILAIAVAGARAASTGSCDPGACGAGDLRHLHFYYEELACKPVVAAGECCPTSYDCSDRDSRDKSRCYFRGQALEVRPDLEQLDPSVCLAGCFCRQTKEAGAVAQLTCAHIECPTLFNPSLIPEGCVATYSGNKCCSDGVLCQHNVTADTAKCEWGGKTYLEGQKFYPDEEPCKVCTCRKGYDGTLAGPWCSKVTCGLELHHSGDLAKGCAPVFHDSSKCCPIEWRCPSEDDVVVAAATGKAPGPESPSAPAATCKWGSLTLKPGESVAAAKREASCKRCRCDVPPHVTCETNGQPCDGAAPALPVAAPEAAPEAAVVAVAADAKASRRRRSPGITCANVRCARACVMEDGRPKCK